MCEIIRYDSVQSMIWIRAQYSIFGRTTEHWLFRSAVQPINSYAYKKQFCLEELNRKVLPTTGIMAKMALLMASKTTQCVHRYTRPMRCARSDFAIPSSCDPNLSFTGRIFAQKEKKDETLGFHGALWRRSLAGSVGRLEHRQIPFPTPLVSCKIHTVLSYPIRDTNPRSNDTIPWWKNKVPNAENLIQAPFPRLAEIGSRDSLEHSSLIESDDFDRNLIV